MQLSPEGSVFYWDGILKNGQSIPPGAYSVVVQAHSNDPSVQIISQPITIHQGG
jgi:flagellar hook assembly protein FlgD